jgi:hypothetical protein
MVACRSPGLAPTGAPCPVARLKGSPQFSPLLDQGHGGILLV